MFLTKYKSIVGDLFIVASKDKLRAIMYSFESTIKLYPDLIEKENGIHKKTIKQLNEYFNGKREVFDVPYELVGTPFQLKVWNTLAKIKYGKINHYQQIAMKIKNPKAQQAVGMTNGKNPISIIIPCHRVIGKDGSLTGYAGGLDKKEFLLELEGNNLVSTKKGKKIT